MVSRFCTQVSLFAIVILTALPAAAHADAITSLFNTGVDELGASLFNNAAELHYSLINVPSGTSDVRVANSANGFPIGPWVGDSPISAWIGPKSGSNLDGPVGNYDYQTTFTLAGLNPASASISGQWSVDNDGVDILLNGISTGFTAAGFESFYSFAINSGFADGVNTLDFIVKNQGGPTGLRTELAGVAEVPEPASMALLGAGLLGLAFTHSRRA